MIETIFRAFVILQPFFWIWVLEDPERFDFINLFETSMAIITCSFIGFVAVMQISIGFYTTVLIVFYSFFVWWVCSRCLSEFNYSFREGLAIGFLIVYLNSWYWEGVLHLWAIAEHGMNLNQAVQMLHLIPGIYFLIRWEFDRNQASNELLKGWAFAGLISFSKMNRVWELVPFITDEAGHLISQGLLMLMRIVCLWFLTNAIIRWGMPKKPVQLLE